MFEILQPNQTDWINDTKNEIADNSIPYIKSTLLMSMRLLFIITSVLIPVTICIKCLI